MNEATLSPQKKKEFNTIFAFEYGILLLVYFIGTVLACVAYFHDLGFNFESIIAAIITIPALATLLNLVTKGAVLRPFRYLKGEYACYEARLIDKEILSHYNNKYIFHVENDREITGQDTSRASVIGFMKKRYDDTNVGDVITILAFKNGFMLGII